MRDIHSHNDSLSRRIADFFVPSWLGIVAYLLAATYLLAAMNYKLFMELLVRGTSYTGIENLIAHDELSVVLYRLNDSLATATVMFFWLVVGALIHSLIWFFQNMLHDLHDDLTINQVVAPRVTKSTHWQSTFSRYMAFFATLFSLIGFFVLFVMFTLPQFANQAVLWVLDRNDPILYLKMLAAIVSVALCLYLIVILFKIFRYSAAVINEARS